MLQGWCEGVMCCVEGKEDDGKGGKEGRLSRKGNTKEEKVEEGRGSSRKVKRQCGMEGRRQVGTRRRQ